MQADPFMQNQSNSTIPNADTSFQTIALCSIIGKQQFLVAHIVFIANISST